MKLIFTFLVCFSVSHVNAQQGPMDARVATMVKNCQLPMGQSTCAVENTDKATCATTADPMKCRRDLFRERYPNGKLLAGAGRFTADEVFIFVDADKRMCDQIIAECKPDASGWDRRPCALARGLWQAYSTNPPGRGIGGAGK